MTQDLIVSGLRFRLIEKGKLYDIEYVACTGGRVIGWADTRDHAIETIKRWLAL